MDERETLFFIKVALSCLLGIIAGIFKISASLGISIFIFLLFLIGFLYFNSGRKELGLYSVYREGIGTSFLGFILIWSLFLTIAGGGITIYAVEANGTGIYPLVKVTGPSALDYNISYVHLGGKHGWPLQVTDVLDLWLGKSLTEGNVTINGYRVHLKNGRFNITFYINPAVEHHISLLSSNVKIEGGFCKIYGKFNITLGNNSSKELVLNEALLRFYFNGSMLKISVENIKLGSNLTAMGVNVFSLEEGRRAYIFVEKPTRVTRTARVDDVYIVVLTP
ncbi:MAG: EMC6 family protein [Candidatus Methanodesulfokora sp.]